MELASSFVVKENVILGCTGGDGISKYVFIQVHLKWSSMSNVLSD